MPEKYSQILDLAKIDVFHETEKNDNTYFNVTGLPQILSYGKHPFTLSYKDPKGKSLLRNGSFVLFEFVDSSGIVIFSDIVNIDSLSGVANNFLWIKKDPLRTPAEIADGPITLYVVGELGPDNEGGVPQEWLDIYNLRSTFVYDVRKDFPNTSPIVFSNSTNIQTNTSFSESVDFDKDDVVYKRSYINVSASHMETNGGQVRFVELSYKESNSKANEFSVITTYPLDDGGYETTDTNATGGLNPVSNQFKISVFGCGNVASRRREWPWRHRTISP